MEEVTWFVFKVLDAANPRDPWNGIYANVIITEKKPQATQ